MKTNVDYVVFINEIKKVCEKHRISMVGTCDGEGIYGEITLYDMDYPEGSGWNEAEYNSFNFCGPMGEYLGVH